MESRFTDDFLSTDLYDAFQPIVTGLCEALVGPKNIFPASSIRQIDLNVVKASCDDVREISDPFWLYQVEGSLTDFRSRAI